MYLCLFLCFYFSLLSNLCHLPISVKTGAPHDLYETDKKWALSFVPNGTAQVSQGSSFTVCPDA